MTTVLHIAKGTTGGLDMISSKLSNELDGEALLLHSKDEFNFYDKATYFECHKIGYEIIFPRLRNIVGIIRKIRQHDIIHIHLTNIVIFFLIIASLGKKKVFTIHKTFGISNHLLLKDKKVSYLLFLIIRNAGLFLYTNTLLINCDRMILLTQFQRNYFRYYSIFRKLYDKKSVVIYNFIPDERIRSKKNKISNLKVIFVGRRTKQKGFFDLIKIANKIKSDSISFSFVGDRTGVSKDRNNKNIKYIKYIGEVDPEDLDSFYDKSNVLILPSYSETFGIVILEAMARGLVVLSSDLPAIREYFKNDRNGFLFKPGDTNKLEKLLLYLKNNPLEIQRISKNNLKDISRFSFRFQKKKYEKLYQAVLNNDK